MLSVHLAGPNQSPSEYQRSPIYHREVTNMICGAAAASDACRSISSQRHNSLFFLDLSEKRELRVVGPDHESCCCVQLFVVLHKGLIRCCEALVSAGPGLRTAELHLINPRIGAPEWDQLSDCMTVRLTMAPWIPAAPCSYS